jgi:GT2 family glycosyltransferase
VAGVTVSDTPVVCSVCIANYNGIDLLETCIESVLAQDWEKPFEIIIHDDASSDGSVDFIRSRYPSIKLIESASNVGFCVANIRMAAVAQGDYLLLLNNDAALLPDALRTLLIEAETLNRPAILGLPQYDAESGQLLDIGSLLDPFLNPVPNLNPERGNVGMVMGACLWIPKKLWEELGGFPEWFGSIGEDLYLCCLARLWGYSVRALGTSGYLHYVGKSFGGGKVADGRLATTFRRRALSERNKSFVMAITYPSPWVYLLFPLHLLFLFMEGLTLILLKRRMDYWRQIYLPCFLALWQERERLYLVRQQVQTGRKLAGMAYWRVFLPFPRKLAMLLQHGLPDIH